MSEYRTPPGHQGFHARKLFDQRGAIQWGAVAHIEPGGGGPAGDHTHSDNHIFIVTEGEAQVRLGGEIVTVGRDEALFVDGMTPHSIWNRTGAPVTVVKISTAR